MKINGVDGRNKSGHDDGESVDHYEGWYNIAASRQSAGSQP